MYDIITEIPPLPEEDCFYIVSRVKDRFDYPVHTHDMFEMNFLSGCRGALRIVGDSVEELGNYDLVFIGHGIPHGWQQHNCRSEVIREITMQFPMELFGEYMRHRSPFVPIDELLAHSAYGVAFGTETTMRVYQTLHSLTATEDYFDRFVRFLTVLRILAEGRDYRLLSLSFPAKGEIASQEERRITKVEAYIKENYSRPIRLEDLSSLVGMTTSSFARFFKLRTGKSTGEFITETRVAVACHQLFFTDKSVSEIGFSCGFNNLSHFCRRFREYRGMSPTEFREMFKHRKFTREHVDELPHL